MRILKRYLKFFNENTLAPSKPGIKEKPSPVETPTPKRKRRDRSIRKPSVSPGIKAEDDLSLQVANRFKEEMENRGESVEKYLDNLND